MIALAMFAAVVGPAAILFGLYMLARSMDHPAWPYVSLAVNVAVAATGLYVLGIAPSVDMTETSGGWFLFRYVLGIGLLVSGVRFGYESWLIKDSGDDEDESSGEGRPVDDSDA